MTYVLEKLMLLLVLALVGIYLILTTHIPEWKCFWGWHDWRVLVVGDRMTRRCKRAICQRREVRRFGYWVLDV